ncbi:host attachment protein [Bosea sp. TAF32]|uniref:host attachment protein n=1 Tax=Bosea sp. TAF32 TaxID=3237482 RepID=UPI003F8E8EB7
MIICDARKAMFLRNEGSPTLLKLEVEQIKQASPNPPNGQQGADRPGRMQNAVAPTSATDETDWHDLAEKQFARETAAALNLASQSGRSRGIVLVAPPRILAVLRQHLDEQSRSRIVAEVDKDLTKHPIHAIERLLTGA